MVRIIGIADIQTLFQHVSLKDFLLELIKRLQHDFMRWNEFKKTPRHAIYYPHGVIELMPVSDEHRYSFKYVTGHPRNVLQKKSNVVALGLLSEVSTGFPLCISEMTLLTALRTAATSAMACAYLINTNAQSMALIGAGAQAEFQVLTHYWHLKISHINYFDQDPVAMDKLAHNLTISGLNLFPAKNIQEAIDGVDIITTATASKTQNHVLIQEWIKPGQVINAIGGDCPGKTELDAHILQHSKIVVENLEQTRHEGEMQQMDKPIYAELWEIVSGRKPGRENPEDVFVFDSVGFALEDFTILNYVYELCLKYNLGQRLDLIPDLANPKDLYSLIKR